MHKMNSEGMGIAAFIPACWSDKQIVGISHNAAFNLYRCDADVGQVLFQTFGTVSERSTLIFGDSIIS